MRRPVQSPHPPLESYYRSELDRSAWVRGVFDRSAEDYDRLERILGFGTGSWYRRCALREAGLAAGMSVVDVGSGTGLLAAAAAVCLYASARATRPGKPHGTCP